MLVAFNDIDWNADDDGNDDDLDCMMRSYFGVVPTVGDDLPVEDDDSLDDLRIHRTMEQEVVAPVVDN